MDLMLQTRRIHPMKTFKILGPLFFTDSTAGIVFSACSQDPGTGSSDSTGSGGARCDNTLISERPECDRCTREQCCSELDACVALDNCVACYLIGDDFKNPPCNTTLATIDALWQCTLDHCQYECRPDLFCTEGKNASDGGGCVDMEPDGGVTIAECLASQTHTAILRG